MTDTALTYIDTHCHFDYEPLAQEAIWQRARAAGVGAMLIPGVLPAQWQRAADSCKALPGAWFAAGVHPREAEHHRDGFSDTLRNFLAQPRCVAIGECGMDGTIDFPLGQQEPVFEQHLQLACELELPLVIHALKAHNPIIRLLKRYRPPARGIIHAFSGSHEIAKTYWELGFHLGIGGTITYLRANKTRHAIAKMPLASLVLETDAPDMPLCGRQGEPNSPERIPEIAASLARLHNTTVEEVAQVTTHNALRLFIKMTPTCW